MVAEAAELVRRQAAQVRSVAVSMGVDKKSERLGGRALQIGDLRLLEDGGERGGALHSDPIASKTASEGRNGNGGRASVSTGADTKANTLGRRRTRGW